MTKVRHMGTEACRNGTCNCEAPPERALSALARAQQAWARRRYPKGHPQHPDTYAD